MPQYDITILTDKRYANPSKRDEYTDNVLKEDRLLLEALKSRGFRVTRTNWDDPDFDWSCTRYVIFRTTWDYFERFEEFSNWLEKVEKKTSLINSKELIHWNIDKHYLLDIKSNGIAIPPTQFFEVNEKRSLEKIVNSSSWEQFVLKPAISGAARHTYLFKKEDANQYNEVFAQLIKEESMLLQEFQRQIESKGEVSYMVFGGKYSHAILKKAKPGDFRVQDDFGGTIEIYNPSEEEIAFAERAIAACDIVPVYARVDVFWDNEDQLILGELELIEPELWFRMNESAALNCAIAIEYYIQQEVSINKPFHF